MLYHGKFRRKETQLCFIIWTSGVLYAIFQFTVAARKYFQHYNDQYDDFTAGWPFFNLPKRDKADFEWETIHYYLLNIFPALICYIILSETLRHYTTNLRLQQYFQIAFTLIYLSYSMGYRATLTVLLQPILFYLAKLIFKNQLIIWICNILSLALIALYKNLNTKEEFLKEMQWNHFEAYLNILLLCWMNLKCTSYSLNTIYVNGSIYDYFSYCFYFPLLFTGPFISYQDFQTIWEVQRHRNLKARLRQFTLNLLRCLFWMIFVDFCLHFVYMNATSFQNELVQRLDLCSLCGYGYLMGQFFHLKYLVLYGLSTSLASFENIPVPSLPRCIGRVHLYSDMWKYFDPGLYDFLKTCIFVPLQKQGVGKSVSSFLCFGFVFIWHGIEEYILIWATLNFTGVFLEELVRNLYNKKLILMNISEDKMRRLKCLLAAPLLAMSAVSNFYFFGGKEVGDVFVYKSLSEPCFKKLLVLSILYCCCETSVEVRDINAHRM